MTETSGRLPRIETAHQKYKNGIDLFISGQLQQALERVTEAIDILEDRSFFYTRCLILLQLKLFDQALVNAIMCVKLNKRLPDGHILKTLCYIKLGDLFSASQCFEELTKQERDTHTSVDEPPESAVYLVNCNYFMGIQDFRAALNEIEDALKIWENSLLFQRLKASALSSLCCDVESDSIMDSIEAKCKSIKGDEMNYRGECFYYLGEAEKAVICFQYAKLSVMMNPYFSQLDVNARSITNLRENAKSAHNEHQYDSAYKHYECALEIDPLNTWSNAKLYFNRSVVCAKMGREEAAVSDCSNAIRLNNRYIKPYLKRAKLYKNSKLWVESERDYRRVYELYPCEEYRQLHEEALLKLRSLTDERRVK